MAAFPTLSKKADSSSFSETRLNPAIRKETDGGYVITRPRYTRAPRKKWKIKYTDLVNADKTLLETHYQTQLGGSYSFTWTNPQDTLSYTVRYVGELTWTYDGVGPTQRWSCSFDLEQV